MSKRNTIELLEEMCELSLRHLDPEGKNGAGAVMATRNGCVLGFCTSIAEQCCDHWDVPALREALREIGIACRWALDGQIATLDAAIMDDPVGMARGLGLPETASAEEIMAELVRRQQASEAEARDRFKSDDDGREREPT